MPKENTYTVNTEDLDNRFRYHPPTANQVDRYQLIRDHARAFAMTLSQNCPDSAEKTEALKKLQEAVMFANASIAINETA